MELKVTRIRDETPVIKAFELAAPDGRELPQYTAGAHIKLNIELPGGQRGCRAYSLVGDPQDRYRYEIAVLHIPNGDGGSNYMHESVAAGVTIHCSEPLNEFALEGNADEHLLIAGGIGITPILSMAYALRSKGASFRLHYAGRSQNAMAYHEKSRQLSGEGFRGYYSQGTTPSRMDLNDILGAPRPGRHVYVCGPNRLIQSVVATARELEWNDELIHRESFGARPESTDARVEVELALSGMTVSVEPGTAILDALINAGAFVSYECKRGECGTCQVRVQEGEPIHRDLALSERQRNEDNLMCTCVSWSSSRRLVLEA